MQAKDSVCFDLCLLRPLEYILGGGTCLSSLSLVSAFVRLDKRKCLELGLRLFAKMMGESELFVLISYHYELFYPMINYLFNYMEYVFFLRLFDDGL